MPDTHDIGQFFWHRIRLRTDAPRHHRHETHEYEFPYRWASSHVLRLFRQLGVVVGRWHDGWLEEESAEYEAHLNRALHSHTHTTNEESYRPLAEVRYTVVEDDRGRNRLAAVDGDEDLPDATRMIPAVES